METIGYANGGTIDIKKHCKAQHLERSISISDFEPSDVGPL